MKAVELRTKTVEDLQKLLADTKKDLIREEAKKAGLLTAEKRDSQGICFVGKLNFHEFFSYSP